MPVKVYKFRPDAEPDHKTPSFISEAHTLLRSSAFMLSSEERQLIGYDERFEARWWRVEKVMWWAGILVLAVAALGVFGRGPLVHRQARAKELQVEFDRIVRYETATKIDITLPAAGDVGRVFVSRTLLDGLQLQSIVPRPLGAQPRPDGVLLFFPADSQRGHVTLVAEPSRVGFAHATVGLADGPRVSFTQFIVP